MSTYQELLARKAALDQQIALARKAQAKQALEGSMPFCVELDNLKDTDAPIHQPAAMLVAAD